MYTCVPIRGGIDTPLYADRCATTEEISIAVRPGGWDTSVCTRIFFRSRSGPRNTNPGVSGTSDSSYG